jgi:hypothetical protein
VRRVPFSCFALPDSFSTVPRASGPVTQKPNREQNRTVRKTAQNSLCPGPYGVPYVSENTPRDMLLTIFDLSIKIFDRYT